MSKKTVSAKFNAVKGYYDSGLWKANRVKMAVKAGWITASEYKTITGETYDE